MAKYNGETILHSKIDLIDDYDTSSGEDNIGFQILDIVRETVKEGEEKFNIRCKDYTVLFVPSNRRSDEISLFVNILSNKSIVIIIGLPTFNVSYGKLISNEIKEKLKYLGDE